MARADKYSNNVVTLEGTGEKVTVKDTLKVENKYIVVTYEPELRFIIEEGLFKFKYTEVPEGPFKQKCLNALQEKANRNKKLLG